MLLLPHTGTRIIAENERLINDSLLQLACQPHFDWHRHTNLLDILEEIADFRFGIPPLPRPSGFYTGPLYWDIYGPDPQRNIAYRMNRLREKYHRIWLDRNIDLMVVALREFYSDYGYGCETGTMDRRSIVALLDKFIAKVVT